MKKWEENLARKMVDHDKKRVANHGNLKRFDMYLPPELLQKLEYCARERGINRAGYIRRALAIQIGKDLDTPWREIIKLCPSPTEWGERKKSWSNERDNGKGYGHWE